MSGFLPFASSHTQFFGDYYLQIWNTYSQNTSIFIIGYRWFTSCQQLYVSASISSIIRLYSLLYNNHTVYNVSVSDDEISFTKFCNMKLKLITLV
jgi:hypothetical protein